MTPKIVLYFSKNNEACYKILRSLEGVSELLSDQALWPIFVDLSFKPMTAEKVCESLSKYPKIPYLSQSLADAMPPSECSFLSDRFAEIETRKVYPILSFMGQPLATEKEAMQIDLGNAKMEEKVSEVNPINTILNMNLSDYQFSVRTTNVLNSNNFVKIGDVLEFSEARLLRLANFGRKSLNELKFFLSNRGLYLKTFGTTFTIDESKLDTFFGETFGIEKRKYDASKKIKEEDIINDYNNDTGAINIFDNLLSVLDKLDERRGIILKKRMGLGEDRKTLEQLGEDFGVTRERIRQIEKQALGELFLPSNGWNPRNIWGAAIEKAFSMSCSPLSANNLVMLDSRFEFQDFGEQALSHLLTNVLSESTACFEVEVCDQTFFAKNDQEEVNTTEAGILSLLPSLEGLSMAEVEGAIKAVIPAELSEFLSLFISNALEHSIVEEVGGEPYLKIYSPRRTSLTIARLIFEDLDSPINNEQISEIIKRDFPDKDVRNISNYINDLQDVFPFGHGLWGTINMLHLEDSEMVMMETLISDFVQQLTKDQFHSVEVHDFTKRHNSYLYDKLDSWKIAGLVRHFGISHYLGRSMFSKTGADAPRPHIIDCAIELLGKLGRPAKELELKEEIKIMRGSLPTQLQIRPPIVRLGGGYFGLESWKTESTDEGIFYQITDNDERFFLDFASAPRGGPPSKQWTYSEIAVLLSLDNEGLPPASIAEKMELTNYAVRTGLIKYRGMEISDIGGEKTGSDALEIETSDTISKWTHDRVELLTKLWDEGHSASKISKVLGGTTRNAVLGKIHRLGLPDRETKLHKFKIQSPIAGNVDTQLENEMTAEISAWTDAEIRKLLTLLKLNYAPAVVAKVLGRGQKDIQNKLDALAANPMSF